MAAAGLPDSVAQDYLRAIASRITLAGGISVEDRFDIVVDRRGGTPTLLYAGLDRVGASDVQLMRWVEDGTAGWVDANGTEAKIGCRGGGDAHACLGTRQFRIWNAFPPDPRSRTLPQGR